MDRCLTKLLKSQVLMEKLLIDKITNLQHLKVKELRVIEMRSHLSLIAIYRISPELEVACIYQIPCFQIVLTKSLVFQLDKDWRVVIKKLS